MWKLDSLDHDTLRKHFNEGVTIDALKEYVQSVGQYLECTSKILYKFGKLNDEEKQQDSDLAAEKLKVVEEISQKSKSKQNARRAYYALGSGAVIGAAIGIPCRSCYFNSCWCVLLQYLLQPLLLVHCWVCGPMS